MNEIIGQIAENTKRAACLSPEDYKDQDGLWVCGKCHTRKQCVIEVPGLIPRTVVFCDCKHRSAELIREENGQKKEERREALRWLSDLETAQDVTLARDDGANPEVRKIADMYIAGWPLHCDTGKYGLIFWGQPGTGKTFFATAIGNALQRQGVTAARVTAAKIVEAMQGMYDYEKTNMLSALNRSDLLILDDLGAERDTAFAREVIFSLIDSRRNLNRNILVTTNLSMKQMTDPRDKIGNPDMGYKRIFDRLLGCCAPVLVAGDSHRRTEGREAREWLRGGAV